MSLILHVGVTVVGGADLPKGARMSSSRVNISREHVPDHVKQIYICHLSCWVKLLGLCKEIPSSAKVVSICMSPWGVSRSPTGVGWSATCLGWLIFRERLTFGIQLYEISLWVGWSGECGLGFKTQGNTSHVYKLECAAVGETLNLLRHSVTWISSKPKLVHGPWQPSLVIKTSDLYQHRTSLCLPGLLDWRDR